jgi:hypothetical protein
MFVLVKFKVQSTSSFSCDQIGMELTAPVSEGSARKKTSQVAPALADRFHKSQSIYRIFREGFVMK